MPIHVYISPILVESLYLPELRYAMNEWETAAPEIIRFEETDTPEQADIRVSWGHSGLMDIQDTRLGSAELTRLNAEQGFQVEVILMLEGDGTIGKLTQEEMRTVCLHEFGHALGLWGHSPHPADINYPTATAQASYRARHRNVAETLQHAAGYAATRHRYQAAERRNRAGNRELFRAHYLLGTVYFDKAENREGPPTGRGYGSGD